MHALAPADVTLENCRGFYKRGRFWWVRFDPVTGRAQSTGRLSLAEARTWVEARKTERLNPEELDALWAAYYDEGRRGLATCIYFVRHDRTGLVKIGWTCDFDQRLASLQSANPEPLTPLVLVHGSQALEKRTHHVFAAYRERGEWFRRDGELDRFLSDLEHEAKCQA